MMSETLQTPRQTRTEFQTCNVSENKMEILHAPDYALPYHRILQEPLADSKS